MVHVSRKTRRGCQRLCKSWDEYRPCQPGPQAGRRGRGEPARFVTYDTQNRGYNFRYPSTDLPARVHWLARIKSEVQSHRGGSIWQFRRISLNWNVNTRVSKTNYTKHSCTFQQTTCKLLS